MNEKYVNDINDYLKGKNWCSNDDRNKKCHNVLSNIIKYRNGHTRNETYYNKLKDQLEFLHVHERRTLTCWPRDIGSVQIPKNGEVMLDNFGNSYYSITCDIVSKLFSPNEFDIKLTKNNISNYDDKFDYIDRVEIEIK